MEKELTLCNEGLHYTGIQIIEEGRFKGGVELIQAYPSPLLGHSVEKVVIRSEDIPKVIKFLQDIQKDLPKEKKWDF